MQQPHRPIQLSIPWAILAMVLVVSGCGLEKPQAPDFQTNLYIPIGVVRTTGLDILKDNPHVTGDSTGAEPLAIVVEGGVDRFTAEEVLDFSLSAEEFSASIDTIEFENPEDIEVEFSLEEISRIPIPSEGGPIIVPSFLFPPLHRELEDRTEFSWIHLSEGEARISVTNELPVPIGADDGLAVLRFELRSRGEEVPVVSEWLPGVIAAGGNSSWDVDLAGIELEQELDIDVRGGSTGSQGDLVWVEPSQRIVVDVTFEMVRPDSLVAPIDPQSFSMTGAVSLAEDLRILEGEILSGTIPVDVTNPIPLRLIAKLSFPELFRDGEMLAHSEVIAAGGAGNPGLSSFDLDLDGVSILVEGPSPADSLRYRLDVETPGSFGAHVPVGTNQRLDARMDAGDISMSWVRGSADSRRFEVPITETEIDLPDEIEDLEFLQAELVIEATSSIGLSTNADLVLDAITSRGTEASLPFRMDIPPGNTESPSFVRVVLDDGNSDVLDLINVQPSTLRVSGSVFVGGPGEIARVSREDWIEGDYTLTAPLRVKVDRIKQAIDPFSFTVPEDDQDRIRDDIVSAELEGELENHLPLEVIGSLILAESEAGLDSAPDVVLDSVRAAPAEIDTETGRAMAANVTRFRVELDPEEIDFFARDEVWASFELTAKGDGVLPVAIVATDYVELRGHVKLGVEVNP